jgi:hypothetical protein
MKSINMRPTFSFKDKPQNESTFTYQGEAVAIGEDTSASVKMILDLSDKWILSIAKGTSEAVAVARSDPGSTVYTDASGTFFDSDADIIFERTETVRNTWSDESGDWSATVSTTSYFAIDFYWIDFPQKHIQISSDVASGAGRYGSGLSGNTAFGQGAVTAAGESTLTQFFLDVFTLEDNLSSASMVGYASVFV